MITYRIHSFRLRGGEVHTVYDREEEHGCGTRLIPVDVTDAKELGNVGNDHEKRMGESVKISSLLTEVYIK